VITALSHYPSLFVIARNSCFTYKGRAVDVKQVGRELGVRYVLEGSLRKSGNRIRVSAQVVEAESGKHVLAERYDRDLAGIFAVQDEITQAVTIAVAPAIADAELHRAMRKPPGSLGAWAAYQRGLWHLSEANPSDNATAQEFFQKGIELDPTFSGGYSGLALARLYRATIYQTSGLHEAQSAAEILARRAVALDGADAEARSCLSCALRARGEFDGALDEIDRALAMSPNLAAAHGQRGATLIFSGRPTEGVAALDTYMRLDPRYEARSPRPELGNSYAADGNRPLFPPRIRGCHRGCETSRLGISPVSKYLPLACRRSRPSRSDRGSKAGAAKGHRRRAGLFRHVCPRPGALASARRPRPHARRPAEGRMAGISAPVLIGDLLRSKLSPKNANFVRKSISRAPRVSILRT